MKAEKQLETPKPKTKEDYRSLIEKASKGDESVLPVLRELIQQSPSLIESVGGDLPKTIERTILGSMAGDNLFFREAVNQKLNTLRNELSGANPSPLERLLIDRVVVAWLRLHDAELRQVKAASMPIAVAKYHEGRIETLNRQFLTSVKALATVRKLAIPVLIGQINIAAKQANQTVTTVG